MDNWLINILALVLFVVVLDGARRAYFKHRDTMKVSRNLSRAMRQDMDARDYDDLNGGILSGPRTVEPERVEPKSASRETPATLADSELEYIDPEEAEKRRQIAAELPGTVRVVQRRKPEDASQVNRKVQQNFQSSRKPLAGSKPERAAAEAGAQPMKPFDHDARTPQQASLNLEEQVPTLMDSVEQEMTAEVTVAPTALEPRAVAEAELAQADGEATVREAETLRASVEASAAIMEREAVSYRREPSLDETVSLESLHTVESEHAGAVEEEPEQPRKSGWATADLKFPELKKASPFARKEAAESKTEPAKSRGASARKSSARKEREVEEVLILNIMAPPGDYFEGNDLLRVLLSSGLRFGDMNIFHFHTGEAGEGPALFSLANIVVPGTFDMSEMEDFTTPGVSLFLALPAEVEALKALDTLLTTARNIAEQLGGELKDENRSVFTGQTAEHYRQRVMEFQRRKALARAQA